MAVPVPKVQAQVPGGRGYATVILSPHQDDEFLRLAGYILYATDEGDNVALITATNGAATVVGPALGLSPAETTEWRNREQWFSWLWLTDGRGHAPINLGFQDGQAKADQIYQALKQQFAGMTGKPELYVASWHHDRDDSVGNGNGDRHPDHIACVLAARRLAEEGVTVRFARHASKTNLSGTVYYARTERQKLRLRAAYESWVTIGRRSVKSEFAKVMANNGLSRVTW